MFLVLIVSLFIRFEEELPRKDEMTSPSPSSTKMSKGAVSLVNCTIALVSY